MYFVVINRPQRAGMSAPTETPLMHSRAPILEILLNILVLIVCLVFSLDCFGAVDGPLLHCSVPSRYLQHYLLHLCLLHCVCVEGEPHPRCAQ